LIAGGMDISFSSTLWAHKHFFPPSTLNSKHCVSQANGARACLHPRCLPLDPDPKPYSPFARCISRQRSWGVPIPVFYHKETGEPLLTEDSMEHVRKIVEEKGTDAWFELDEAELLPPSHKDDAANWVKGKDTMDVWFDSGSSWAGVVQTRKLADGGAADMYLEGSDQHRGWFQSSLLTSVAATGKAPYKTVLTHG